MFLCLWIIISKQFQGRKYGCPVETCEVKVWLNNMFIPHSYACNYTYATAAAGMHTETANKSKGQVAVK